MVKFIRQLASIKLNLFKCYKSWAAIVKFVRRLVGELCYLDSNSWCEGQPAIGALHTLSAEASDDGWSLEVQHDPVESRLNVSATPPHTTI